MLCATHSEDHTAEDRADDLVEDVGGESFSVEQHFGHGVVSQNAVHRPVAKDRRSARLDNGVYITFVYCAFSPQLHPARVRIADGARPVPTIEDLKGVRGVTHTFLVHGHTDS